MKNTPIWNDYIQFYTTRPATLAIVQKAATAQPVTLCTIRLPDKVTYRNGVKTVREQWSHACYEYV